VQYSGAVARGIYGYNDFVYTYSETYPGYGAVSWTGMLAPAGTPKAIIDKVAADVKEAVESPEVRDKLIAQGAVPQASTPAELQKLIDADRARYGKIIRDKGLKAE